jgi:hypothetical protein
MVVNINNIVAVVRIVRVMRVVRISSWIGINGLIIVMNSLMMDWRNLGSGIAFYIMGDSLMWHSYIIFSHVVVMIIMSVTMVVVVNVMMLVIKSNSTVFVVMVICTVINFMFSLVCDVFVLNIVMSYLVSLNMWLNLMDCSLFKRSMI